MSRPTRPVSMSACQQVSMCADRTRHVLNDHSDAPRTSYNTSTCDEEREVRMNFVSFYKQCHVRHGLSALHHVSMASRQHAIMCADRTCIVLDDNAIRPRLVLATLLLRVARNARCAWILRPSTTSVTSDTACQHVIRSACQQVSKSACVVIGRASY